MAQNTYPFELKTPDSLIDIECRLKEENYRFALDTGASHTVIDLAALMIAGYDLHDVVRTVQLETGNGSVDGYIFKLAAFTALGITRVDIEVCSYDFFSSNVFAEIHGVLGLDFFTGVKFCIDLAKFELTISE
jgi:Aspartyl protease